MRNTVTSPITRLYIRMKFLPQISTEDRCVYCLLLKTYFLPKVIFHITKEKDLEICAVELEPKSSKLNILSLF